MSLPAAVIFRRARPDIDRATVAVTGAWLALGLSALGALVGCLALPFLLREAASASLAQAYLLAFVPLNLLALALLALDQGDMRFARYNLTRLLPSAVVPAALLIANSVSLAYLLAVLRRQLALSSRECWGLSLTTARQVWWHGRALLRGAGPVAVDG